MFSESDNAGYLFHKGNAQAFVMIGAEGNSIIGHAKAQPHSGVPAVRTGNFGVLYIVERGFNLEPAIGGDEIAVGVNRDPIAGFDTKCEEQQGPALVEPIGEELWFAWFHKYSGVIGWLSVEYCVRIAWMIQRVIIRRNP